MFQFQPSCVFNFIHCNFETLLMHFRGNIKLKKTIFFCKNRRSMSTASRRSILTPRSTKTNTTPAKEFPFECQRETIVSMEVMVGLEDIITTNAVGIDFVGYP